LGYVVSICICNGTGRQLATAACDSFRRTKDETYRAAGHLVVAALASDLEGNIVRGVALDLEGAGREVVEVLVEELDRRVNGK
jgi:hypothetical protein